MKIISHLFLKFKKVQIFVMFYIFGLFVGNQVILSFIHKLLHLFFHSSPFFPLSDNLQRIRLRRHAANSDWPGDCVLVRACTAQRARHSPVHCAVSPVRRKCTFCLFCSFHYYFVLICVVLILFRYVLIIFTLSLSLSLPLSLFSDWNSKQTTLPHRAARARLSALLSSR